MATLNPGMAGDVLNALRDLGRLHGELHEALSRAHDLTVAVEAHFIDRSLRGSVADAYTTACGDASGLALLWSIGASIEAMSIGSAEPAMAQEQVRSEVAWAVHGVLADVARRGGAR